MSEVEINEGVVDTQDEIAENDAASTGRALDARTQVLIIGAVAGLIFGVVAAQLYLNVTPVERDQEGQEQIVPPSPGRMLKFGLGALSLLRQIVE
jgi:hypothetical protein